MTTHTTVNTSQTISRGRPGTTISSFYFLHLNWILVGLSLQQLLRDTGEVNDNTIFTFPLVCPHCKPFWLFAIGCALKPISFHSNQFLLPPHPTRHPWTSTPDSSTFSLNIPSFWLSPSTEDIAPPAPLSSGVHLVTTNFNWQLQVRDGVKVAMFLLHGLSFPSLSYLNCLVPWLDLFGKL